MFTGIVEELGIVRAVGGRLEVAVRTVGEDSAPGASLAVNGVCLTVVDRRGGGNGDAVLAFELSPETLARSALGDVAPGDRVNLERPVTLLQRLGGHLVQGHVDGVGTVLARRDTPPGTEMTIGLPQALGAYVVEKGSIGVDGVSLTVTGVGDGWFGVALIPHTLTATTLGTRSPSDRVNVEVDIMAKYVERLLRRTG